jgi:hypothetical protein
MPGAYGSSAVQKEGLFVTDDNRCGGFG